MIFSLKKPPPRNLSRLKNSIYLSINLSIMATRKSKNDDGSIVIQIARTEEEKKNPAIAAGRVNSYTVPENEKGSVHAEIEKVKVIATGPNAGQKESAPFVQKFDPIAWSRFAKSAVGLGFSYVRVLYAPEGVKTETPKPVKK